MLVLKVGFTGTGLGMTSQQRRQLEYILRLYKIEEFHHGDCVGADAQAHDIAEKLGLCIVVHPPLVGLKRAFKTGRIMCKPAPYLNRNHDIVNATDTLIATPKGNTELVRSGTWSTVRFARKANKTIFIILPDGNVKER